MNKILTIVIPTFNMESYLDRCLTSLIVDDKELMGILEVLVINDGSKDRSSSIGHVYEEKHPHTFRVVDKENGNYGSCVNRGIQEARGKYIKILDADDCFDTVSLKKFLCTLKELDVDLIVTDGRDCFEKTHKTINWRVGCKSNTVLPIANLPSIWMHTITYRTDILHKINYHQTEGISYTDEEWAFWPMVAVRTFYYLPLHVYCYTLEREGQTVGSSSWLNKYFQEIQISRPMIEYVSNLRGDEPAYGYLCDKLFTRMRHFYYRVVAQYGICNSKDIVELDVLLKEKLPRIYKNLSDDVYLNKSLPIRYIHFWRKFNHRIPIYHPFGAILLLYRIGKKIKNRLLG